MPMGRSGLPRPLDILKCSESFGSAKALSSDQEPQRSRGPDDRPAPPHRDEMNRKTAPGRDSVAPSSPTPVANRITATESPTKEACNELLQQNRHFSDLGRCPTWVRKVGQRW